MWVLVAPFVCMFSVCLACFISLLYLVDCLSEDAGLSCDLWLGVGGDYYGLVRLLSWTSGWRATRHPNRVINVIPIFYNKYFNWQLFMFHIFSFLGFGGRQRGQIFKIKGRNSTLMLERCYCLLDMCSSWSWVNDLRGGKNKRKNIYQPHICPVVKVKSS